VAHSATLPAAELAAEVDDDLLGDAANVAGLQHLSAPVVPDAVERPVRVVVGDDGVCHCALLSRSRARAMTAFSTFAATS
jgi:hypothetical protein